MTDCPTNGARRLSLFHHYPLHDDAKIEEMVSTARKMAAGSNLEVTAASESESIILKAAGDPLFTHSLPGTSIDLKINNEAHAWRSPRCQRHSACFRKNC